MKSKNKLISKLLTAFLFVVTYMLLSIPAFALTVSPAIEELTITPGAEQTGTIKITPNLEDTQSTYYLSSQNFEPRGESGVPYFTTTNEGLASWISVQDQVTVSGSQTAEIPYTISVPTNTAPGGYFASIFLGTQPPVTDSNLDKDTQVSIGGKVGVLVLLRVAGDIDEEGGIVEFGTEQGQRFFKNSPINFMYRFNNDGGDRVSPTGTITIKNLFGFKTDTLEVNEQKSNVLPGSIRKFNFLWGQPLEIEEDASFLPKLLAKIKHQYSNFHFGYYSATLDLSWGVTETLSDTAKFSFFVFPLELMILLAILLVAIVYLVKVYNRWLISKAVKAMNSVPEVKEAKSTQSLENDEFPSKGKPKAKNTSKAKKNTPKPKTKNKPTTKTKKTKDKSGDT